jgi:hypothetical protein
MMSLQIGPALREGGRNLLSRIGAILLVTYIALMGALLAVSNTMVAALYRQAGLTAVADGLPLVLDVPLAVAGGGYLLGIVAATYHSLVAVRTFVAGARDSFPPGAFTRNVPLGILNILVGGLAYGLLVAVGTVALVVPGVIAYVAFLFMLPYIAVEDRNFVDALRSSYRLSKGHWLMLFVLVVIVVSASGLVGGIAGFLSGLLLPPVVGQAVIVVVQAPASLYTVAVLAAAFTQLRDAERERDGSAPAAADTPSTTV